MVPYLEEQTNLMAYYRKGEAQTLLVLGNYQAKAQDVILPASVQAVLLNNLPDFNAEDGVLHMAPWQFAVVELAQ